MIFWTKEILKEMLYKKKSINTTI